MGLGWAAVVRVMVAGKLMRVVAAPVSSQNPLRSPVGFGATVGQYTDWAHEIKQLISGPTSPGSGRLSAPTSTVGDALSSRAANYSPAGGRPTSPPPYLRPAAQIRPQDFGDRHAAIRLLRYRTRSETFCSRRKIAAARARGLRRPSRRRGGG